jgi:hypothetical protein
MPLVANVCRGVLRRFLRKRRVPGGKVWRGNPSSKRGNKDFYKGRGAPSIGVFTADGKNCVIL